MAEFIKLQGFSELVDALNRLEPKLEVRGLRAANFAGAKVLVNAAKQTTAFHDETGDLRAAIAAFRRSAPKGRVTHAVGVKGAIKMRYGNTAQNRRLRRVGKRYSVPAGPALYGRFLEFGTSKMSPHPFLRPAFIANVWNILDAIKDGLRNAIAGAAKR